MPRKSVGQMHAFKVLKVHARGVGLVDHLCVCTHTHQTKIILLCGLQNPQPKYVWKNYAGDLQLRTIKI